MPTVNSDVDPMDGSLCRDCAYMFSRSIVPFDYEEYDIDPNDFDLKDGEEIVLGQHICLVSDQVLDCTVLQCNKYHSVSETAFFSSNPYDVKR